MTKLFFATDIHGSDICWKKFLNSARFYEANVMILGGDITGKALVPLIQQPNGSYKATLLEHTAILGTETEAQTFEKQVKGRGYYPFRTTPEEISQLNSNPAQLDALFKSRMLATLQEWLELADSRLANSGYRCFLCPGNDDMFEVDDLVRQSKSVTLAEGNIVHLDDHFQMISTGWSNPTPWHTYREEAEEALLKRIEATADRLPNPRQAIFNLHCPPYNSGLDDAPELDANLRPKSAGQALIPVGSKGVRQAIERYQPVLSLHGHIHEGRGVSRIGKTTCINPGSSYEQGILLGAIVNLDKKAGVKNYLLTSG